MRAVWLIPSLYFAMICTLVMTRDRLQLWRILKFRYAHNLLMSAYSALVVLYMCGKMSGVALDAHLLMCEARVGAAPFWFASKFIEWTDTVMLLARFKTVETLHLFHHATAASSPEEVAAKVRAVAMDAYTRVPLGGDAKAKLPPHIASLFHGLVRTMTATEFAQTAVAQASTEVRELLLRFRGLVLGWINNGFGNQIFCRSFYAFFEIY